MQPTHKTEDNWSRLLIRIGKQRDRGAFEVIFNHFAPLIKGFVMSQTQRISPEATDTLVKEVMLKIWQKAPGFDPTRISGTSWIFTVVRNARIELIRTEREDAAVPEIAVDTIWDDTQENEPFVFLQRSRGEDAVHQCLQNLPLEQYHILKKVYVENKPHQTIAAELGLPLGIVESRVGLALRKLENSVRHVNN